MMLEKCKNTMPNEYVLYKFAPLSAITLGEGLFVFRTVESSS